MNEKENWFYEDGKIIKKSASSFGIPGREQVNVMCKDSNGCIRSFETIDRKFKFSMRISKADALAQLKVI